MLSLLARPEKYLLLENDAQVVCNAILWRDASKISLQLPRNMCPESTLD